MSEHVDIDQLSHPSADASWFQALPQQRREEFTRKYRDDLKHTASLGVHEEQRWRRESLQLAAVFGLFDALLLSHSSLSSTFLAGALGLVLGYLFTRIDANRLVSAFFGMSAFIVFCFVSRGGLDPQHVFFFLPMGGICAWFGIERETRLFS